MSDTKDPDHATRVELDAVLAANAELVRENSELRRRLQDSNSRLRSAHAGYVPADGSDTSAALQESEDRFRMLADNIAQLAWMANGDGWIFWYNKRWLDYTGATSAAMAGWGWRSAHHPDHIDRVLSRYQSSLASGEAWEDVFPLRGADGNYRWFLSRALPIRDAHGKLVRWFGTNTDVTEQREAEERLFEADRRKDEYIAMLGHELRNPLAAIRSASEVIASLPLKEPLVARALATLNRQTTQMAKLVDGLLEVTRISRGKIDLDKKPLDLLEVLRLVLEDQYPVALLRGVELRAELGVEPRWIEGDPVRIAQVFENLIGNALKFSCKEDVVRVVVTEVGSQVVVSVKDQGTGIAPEMLQGIFQPFVQGAQNAARESGGLGLGLAVAKGLVELHGGTITAHSEGLGAGSNFIVFLNQTTARQVDVQLPPMAVPARRILLVEDNEDAAAMLALGLKRRGHEVCTAALASTGLSALHSQPIDVVVCDLGLPDMDGYEFASAVRADPTLGPVRLIALTGYGQSSDRQLSIEAGFDVYLTKPANLDAVEKAMCLDDGGPATAEANQDTASGT